MDVYRRRCSSCCSLLLLLLFGSRQKLKEFVPTPIRILDILSILQYKILYSQHRGYESTRENLDVLLLLCQDCVWYDALSFARGGVSTYCRDQRNWSKTVEMTCEAVAKIQNDATFRIIHAKKPRHPRNNQPKLLSFVR